MKMFQQGTTLLLSLVFLVLLGIAGTAAIRMSSNNLQFNNALIDHQRAFQAAEMGLRLAEERLNQQTALFSDANNCVDGLCFFGTFDPGHSCSHNPEQMQEQLAELSNYYAHQSSGVRLYSQTHFLCFLPRPEATTSQLQQNPAPSEFWQAQYLIQSLSLGSSGQSTVKLQSLVLRAIDNRAARLPAIFSVNNDLNNVSNIDIKAFFGNHFDGSNTLGITYGQQNLALQSGSSSPNVYDLYVEPHLIAECIRNRPNYIGTCLPREDYPNNLVGNELKICGVANDGRPCADNSAQQVNPMPDEHFFQQYFNKPRDELIRRDLVATKTDQAWVNPEDIASTDFRGKKLIVIDGDIDLSRHKMPSAPTGIFDEDAIVYIKGNFLAPAGSYAWESIPNVGLIYIEQDLIAYGGFDFTSSVAVEGNANLFAAVNFRPNRNAQQDLARLNPETGIELQLANRVSWQTQ